MATDNRLSRPTLDALQTLANKGDDLATVARAVIEMDQCIKAVLDRIDAATAPKSH